MEYTPRAADFEQRVRDSFARQSIMRLLGARLSEVVPGRVTITLPYRHDLCQQHGFFHAGVTSTIADSAGGYAGFTLFPAESSVMTVEFKINFLAPADGELLRAEGRVVRPGRRLTVCDVDVLAEKGGNTTLCARLTQTLICLENKPDQPAAKAED
jgi:uncharacterized protein (TIGR00369 family)